MCLCGSDTKADIHVYVVYCGRYTCIWGVGVCVCGGDVEVDIHEYGVYACACVVAI